MPLMIPPEDGVEIIHGLRRAVPGVPFLVAGRDVETLEAEGWRLAEVTIESLTLSVPDGSGVTIEEDENGG